MLPPSPDAPAVHLVMQLCCRNQWRLQARRWKFISALIQCTGEILRVQPLLHFLATLETIVYYVIWEESWLHRSLLLVSPVKEGAERRQQIKSTTHLIFICRDSYLISASFITTQATQAVSIVWMSRAQNYTVFSTCLAPNWTCHEVCIALGFLLCNLC